MEEQKLLWPKLEDKLDYGQWHGIYPEGALCSDGEPWHGTIYKGTEDGLIVYFCGGGVSVNAYTAARGTDFYFTSQDRDGFELMGMPVHHPDNPFKDWSKVILPYATGDFHVGTADFPYIRLDGGEGVALHHGYTNCMLVLKEAMKHLDMPKRLVLAGFSAGGFGVSMLANDLICQFFSTVENITVVADSPLLICDHWNSITKDVWGAPEHIVSRTVGENLALDHLMVLAKDHPNVKILLTSSIRDGDLGRYIAFLENGSLVAERRHGDFYQQKLKEMVDELSKHNKSAFLLWEEMMMDEQKKLTGHTIIFTPHFFESQVQGTTAVQWVTDAVNDELKNYGLDLLKKVYT